MLRHRRKMIGLDIGKSSIKAAQVSFHDKGPRLDGCVAIHRGSQSTHLECGEAQRLGDAMLRRGLTATDVVLVAPSDALIAGSLSVPPADSGVKRDLIVATEIARTHKLAPESFEMIWWDLPATSSGSRVSLAHALALPHQAVESTLDVLNHHGLSVVRTLPGSVALLSAAQRVPVDPRCISAAIDLGTHCAHLSLFYSGRVVHERMLSDFNLQAIRTEACKLLGVSEPVAAYAIASAHDSDYSLSDAMPEAASLVTGPIQALADEIGMSFAYVSHLYPEAELGQLLLSGGGANVVGIAAMLQEFLELDTLAITPQSLLSGDGFGSECGDPALVAAVGAALYTEVQS